MAERFRQIVDRIVEKWKSWSAKQKTIIISTAAVILVAVAIIAFAVTRPNYEVLTTCQDYTELGSVTSILNENGYKYQVQDNTLVVKVEKKNLTNAKMAIASADIKSDGYTFDDAMKSSFTTTESDKTKQFAHYLEAKFVSDLESMDGIKSASVSVDIPDTSSSFYATTAEKSVSVVVDTNKTISDDTAESIANFLATAAGNSTTNNITIIDNKGTTLFSGLSNAGTVSGVSNAGKQKYKAQIEATTINSLRKGLLSTGLYDDVNLTLNYVLDWDAVNTIATEYSTQGDEQAIFGESYEEISTGSTGASGTPGTASSVEAGGNIEADSILHSKVRAKGTIKASGRNGLIVGGEVRSICLVEAKNIGNEMGTATVVGVGVDPAAKKRVDELKTSLQKLGDSKIQLNQIMTALRKKQEIEGKLTPDKVELQQKTMRNLVMIEKDLTEQKNELEQLRQQLGEDVNARVRVNGNIYIGVKLIFGEQNYFIKEKRTFCQFVKDKADIKWQSL